jgi:signal transduction histidine kinase
MITKVSIPNRVKRTSFTPMRWQRLAVFVVLLLAWAAFAYWQYQGYLYQRSLIEETLHQQSHSVMNALVGGVRSHRRLGYYFEVQIQGLLDELVKSEDVLAVAICSHKGEPLLSAGQTELLPTESPVAPGDHWDTAGFRLVESFDIAPRPPGGEGGGRGFGRGQGRHVVDDPRDTGGAFAGGGQFYAALLLDRQRCDRLRSRNAWVHFFVTMAAGLVLFCVALAWWASVRLVEARGRASILEAETRHWRELSQAAAGLAHETRNPLGLIRGWTQRLADVDIEDEKREQHSRSVIEECDRVTARINQFLSFARPCDPELTQVNAREVIDELAGILQPDLEAKNLSLKCDEPMPTQSIRADRELFRQVLFNLLQNAIQFSPPGDVVRITMRPSPDGCYQIAVTDRGPGVSEDAVDSLFTPYFTTRSDGTGLGLAIVRRIATAHSWDAAYEPGPDGGAVFALRGIHG